jgi:predicted ABC-type sugar transport system permease subunit
MGKMFFLLGEQSSKYGIPAIYFVIAAVVLVVAGYFLLKRKK